MGKNRVVTKEMHEAYRAKVAQEQEQADEQARERQFKRLAYRTWDEHGRPGTLSAFEESLRQARRDSVARKAEEESAAARAAQRRVSRI